MEAALKRKIVTLSIVSDMTSKAKLKSVIETHIAILHFCQIGCDFCYLDLL